MKKYLITGYSGFVSQHFLELLESMKIEAEVLGVDVNEPVQEGSYVFIKTSFQQVDLLDKKAVYDMLSSFRPDYILHLASYSSVAYSWKFPADAFVNNTNIFLNLVDQIRLLDLKCRILSVGSSEEYGDVDPADLPLKETMVTKPKSPYAVARVSQQMLSEMYAKSFGIDMVITRSFNHIGPGQKDIFVISSFAKKLTDIKKGLSDVEEITAGNLSLIRDFVDVRDVVKAYYLLLQNGRRGEVYNICSGNGSLLEDVLKKMMEIAGVQKPVRIDESLIRPDDNKVIIGSNKKISDELQWQPSIPLEKSLSDIIGYWFNKN